MLRNSKSNIIQVTIMKKNEMNIYQAPEVEILNLKIEGLLCQSLDKGTEDVEEGWGIELM